MPNTQIKYIFVSETYLKGKTTLAYLFWSLNLHIRTAYISEDSTYESIKISVSLISKHFSYLEDYIKTMSFREVY